MAIVHPSRCQKEKLLLFFHPMLRIHCHRCTLSPDTEALIPEEDVQDYRHGNANSSGGVDICGDVRRLCKQGRLKEATHILHFMHGQGIRPDSSTYGSLLQECGNKRALREGKLVHSHMIDMGFNSGMCLGDKLVIMYAKCGSLMDARRVFDEMPERNVISWTVMIAAYARHGYPDEALALFYQMQRTGTQPNQFTFASVLPAYASLAALEHGRTVHGDIISRGFESNVFVGNALVDMYAKCRTMETACQMFDRMSERNVVSWSAMIAGYAQNGNVDEALKLFQKMPERDVVSCNAMITGYAQHGEVDMALKLFQDMPERDVASWTAMVAGHAQNGQVGDALRLFEKMPDRNVVSWTAMIAGCAGNGHADLALKFFHKMRKRNVVSWNTMIAGCAQNEHVDEALKLFQKLPLRNVVSWNTMIGGCAQNGCVDEALKLFQNMPERNVVSWNIMIAGYVQNGHFNLALKFFRQMQLTCVKPVPATFITILTASASLAALKNGKEIHANALRCGFEPEIFVGSALVDMYAKCGSMEGAFKVFDKMPKRDVVPWTAMIVGYAIHGCGKEALQLFEQMQHSGMRPNDTTFVGVLSACCHAGLVDDGWQYFYRMSSDYHITPTVEHYCCMVDLLGRAGHLGEAHDFIKKMPIKPNAAVWGSLLAACRIHNNVELGEHVAEYLFELEPRNAANYVMLSNMYAVAGRWDDVEKVQKMRKYKRIKKSPGCSWIQVNNKVHSFLVRDTSHPQSDKIYAELDRLTGQMKAAGYVPNANLELHDVEEEQNEHFLLPLQ